MPPINYLAVIVAGLASFAGSVIWYMIFGDAMARLQREWRRADPSAGPQALAMLGFVATGLVLALTVALLFALIGVSGWLEAVGLGFVLWIGFCATQWVGSILGEGVPLKLAAIHAGDWLGHMVIISAIIGVWR